MVAVVVNHNAKDAICTDTNPGSCDLRYVSCINLKMKLFKVISKFKSMSEIIRILKEAMKIMQRTNHVEWINVSSHVNTQDSSEFNTWTQVPKHQLVKDKTVVKSLKKSAISNDNNFETLYNLQRLMDNTHQKWKKDHIVHQKVPR